MPLDLSPAILLQGVALAVLAAVLAGLYPAWRMARALPPTRCAMSRPACGLGVAVAVVAAGRWRSCALWRGGRRRATERRCVQASAGGRRRARARATRAASRARWRRARSRFPPTTGRIPSSAPSGGTDTGNLETAAGRHFGFQLTFFRTALAPPRRRRRARLRVGDAPALPRALRAHRHRAAALSRLRAARAAKRSGWPGRRPSPFRVWLEDWSAESEGAGGLPVRLRAAEGRRRHRPGPRERQAAGAPGRPGPQPEGARAGQRVLLLLADADARRAAPCAWAASRSR